MGFKEVALLAIRHNNILYFKAIATYYFNYPVQNQTVLDIYCVVIVFNWSKLVVVVSSVQKKSC